MLTTWCDNCNTEGKILEREGKQWYIETRDAFEPVINEPKYLMNNKHLQSPQLGMFTKKSPKRLVHHMLHDNVELPL